MFKMSTFNQNTRGKHNTAVQNTGKLDLTINNNSSDSCDGGERNGGEKHNSNNSQTMAGHWSTANMTGNITAETVNFAGNNNPSLPFIAVIVVIAVILYHILQN